ncbi:hypothetical protein HY638_03640 [Candidatus Woesearchaeota archaeon]|nr:hypothetical protein [Candidatus Woesearchaeota archaeon]
MEYHQAMKAPEPEDPPEIVGSAMLLVRHRDPLHHVEVKYDLPHLFRELNWSMNMISREFWDMNDLESSGAGGDEYEAGEEYDASEVYTPNTEEMHGEEADAEPEEHDEDRTIEDIVSEPAPAEASPIGEEILKLIESMGEDFLYDVSSLLRA